MFRPRTKEELFNLHHAQARNMVKHIFGVVKKHWDILNQPSQYDMDIQAAIPAGLAAVHNFIIEHDNTDLSHYLDDDNPVVVGNPHRVQEDFGSQGNGSIPPVGWIRAEAQRGILVQAMWDSYQSMFE